ncbi:hypothetical protein ACHQM5_028358 [Ranunculus cassubicifolius]
MGSNDNAITVNNSVPFSIRNYVLEAREQDIRNNWPFHDRYLDICTKHGINGLLPPFESQDSSRYSSYGQHTQSCCAQEGDGYIGPKKDSCVGVNKEKEFVKVESNTCIDEAVSEITKQMSPLSLSVNKNQQGDSGLSSDIPSLSMEQTIKSFCKKRKKYKGKRKKRSMAEIYADAKPCTLEDLVLANGAIPYASDNGTTESKRCENEINCSTTTLDHDDGNNPTGSLKMPLLSSAKEEKNNYVREKNHIIKIMYSGCKSNSDNKKGIS